jgi:lipopolysaccharide biosynthesis regulator YciM
MEFDWRLAADVMSFYSRLGVQDRYDKYSNYLERKCWELVNSNQADMNSYYNPYRILMEIYEQRQEYTKAIDVLNRVSAFYPNDPGIKNRIVELQTKLKLAGTQKDSTHK